MRVGRRDRAVAARDADLVQRVDHVASGVETGHCKRLAGVGPYATGLGKPDPDPDLRSEL